VRHGRRDADVLGFTTSLGFGKKLERITTDPHVSLAFHSREHGFSASPAFLLVQGTATGPGNPAGGLLCRRDPPSRAGHPVVVPISRRVVTIAPPVASTTT
jgi:hypothetical protein